MSRSNCPAGICPADICPDARLSIPLYLLPGNMASFIKSLFNCTNMYLFS